MDYPEDSSYIGEYSSGYTYYCRPPDSDGDVGHMCLGCREHWESHANTVKAVLPYGEGTVEVQFRDRILFDIGGVVPESDQLPLEDAPRSIENAVLSIVADEGWHSTDGWRGHTTVPDEPTKFVKVESGWHSTIQATDASEFINDLMDGSTKLPFPVITAITTTSNVLSAGVDVWVPAAHEGSLSEHFESATAGRHGSL